MIPDRRGFVRCRLPDHEDRTPSSHVRLRRLGVKPPAVDHVGVERRVGRGTVQRPVADLRERSATLNECLLVLIERVLLRDLNRVGLRWLANAQGPQRLAYAQMRNPLRILTVLRQLHVVLSGPQARGEVRVDPVKPVAVPDERLGFGEQLTGTNRMGDRSPEGRHGRLKLTVDPGAQFIQPRRAYDNEVRHEGASLVG